MRLIRHLPLIAFWAMTAFAANTQAQVKSYREWKAEKVTEAQGKVTVVRAQIDSRRSHRIGAQGVDPNLARSKSGIEATASQNISIDRLERILREEQYDLEVAKDLSVTDYFVGYLTKVQDKKSAFNEVAGKLTAEEVAELMTAYANSVFDAHSADLPTSAANIAKDSSK